MFGNNEIIDHYKKVIANRDLIIEKQKTVIESYQETTDLQSQMVSNLNRIIELNKQDQTTIQAQKTAIQSQKAYIASLEGVNKSQENTILIMERIAQIDKRTIELLKEQNAA